MVRKLIEVVGHLGDEARDGRPVPRRLKGPVEQRVSRIKDVLLCPLHKCLGNLLAGKESVARHQDPAVPVEDSRGQGDLLRLSLVALSNSCRRYGEKSNEDARCYGLDVVSRSVFILFGADGRLSHQAGHDNDGYVSRIALTWPVEGHEAVCRPQGGTPMHS